VGAVTAPRPSTDGTSRPIAPKAGTTSRLGAGRSRVGSIFIRGPSRWLDGDAKTGEAPSHRGLVLDGARRLGGVIRYDVLTKPDPDSAVGLARLA
jgi:hypothetical protein